MNTKSGTPEGSSVAILRAFDADGRLVLEQQMPLDEYWEGLHDLIDSETCRAQRSIRKLVGRLYSQSGTLIQHFENEYSSGGAYSSGWTRHEDGTITRD